MINCSVCQFENNVDAKYCSACGSAINSDSPSGLLCPRCGSPYPLGTIFCSKDGEKLIPVDKKEYICSKCGRIYNAETKFCSVDGSQIVLQSPPFPTYQFHSQARFKYQKAPNDRRFIAYLLDGLYAFLLAIPANGFIIAGISFIIKNSYRGVDGRGTGLIVLGALFLIFPLYYVLCKDGLPGGQSWGKKNMGLMVVNLDNNTPCTSGKSFLRALISALIVIIPYLNFITMWIEPIMILTNEDGRKVADNVANTQVILAQHYRKG